MRTAAAVLAGFDAERSRAEVEVPRLASVAA
jgi:hypothetical protein